MCAEAREEAPQEDQEDTLARVASLQPCAHHRSLLFLFVVQHAARRRSRDPFPADRNVKLLCARGTGRTVTAGDRAGGPGGNNTSDMY